MQGWMPPRPYAGVRLVFAVVASHAIHHGDEGVEAVVGSGLRLAQGADVGGQLQSGLGEAAGEIGDGIQADIEVAKQAGMLLQDGGVLAHDGGVSLHRDGVLGLDIDNELHGAFEVHDRRLRPRLQASRPVVDR